MLVQKPPRLINGVLCLLLTLSGFNSSGQSDTLLVCYYNQNPYAYAEGSAIKGVEIEIIQEFVLWLHEKKGGKLELKYSAYDSFEDFYFSFKRVATANRIGLGSVIINPERTKDIDFTVPYLSAVSFLITNGLCPQIKTKSPTAILQALGSMTAVTMKNTSLHK